MEEQNPQPLNPQYTADPNITDQMRIQLNIDEFYRLMKTFENTPDKIHQIKLLRNNIINMVDSYLRKFNNHEIMTEFFERMKKAKKQAIHGTILNRYLQYMYEIRSVQEYLGISDNIAEKLANQLFNQWKQWEAENNV